MDEAHGQVLRVATYNIHKGVLREYFGLQHFATIHELRTRLHALDADLIFLQEVLGRHDRHAKRFAQWPAERQDQYLARSPTLQDTFQSAYGRNATYLHGDHGNALLSRYRIVREHHLDISDHVLEKRGVLHCEVAVGSLQVHCFVVHLGLLARSRRRQVEALADWIEASVGPDEPLLVAGDFNDWRDELTEVLHRRLGVTEVFGEMRPRNTPARRVAERLNARLAGSGFSLDPERLPIVRRVDPARTYPALIPWLKMDRIYQRGFRVTEARVLRGPGWARLSDHSPLIATLAPA